MGAVADSINHAFRDFVTDGMPSSGSHETRKTEVRQVGPVIETHVASQVGGLSSSVNASIQTLTQKVESIEDAAAAGYKFYNTKALLDADTGQANGTRAWVDRDSTPSNNGLYVSSGGVWTKIGEAPLTTEAANVRINAADIRRVVAQRRWPVTPTIGEIMAPEEFPKVLSFSRASIATRCNAKGRIVQVEAGVPQHDYHPTTGEYLGWLMEPASTNQALYSKEFDNAYWTKTRVTVTPNVATSPGGVLDGDFMEETTETGAHGVTRSGFAVTIGTQYTVSWFVRGVNRNQVWLNVDAGSGGGGISGQAAVRFSLTGVGAVEVQSPLVDRAKITPFMSNWYRVELTFTATGTGTVRAYPTSGMDGNQGFPGEVGKGLHVWGAQFEQGRAASSYIPTSAEPVSRAISVSKVSIGSQSYGTIFVAFRPIGLTTTEQRIVGVYNNESNRAHLTINSAGGLYGGFSFVGNSNTTTTGRVPPDGELAFAAFAWISGRQTVAYDGISVAEPDPEVSVPQGALDFVVGSLSGVSAGAFFGHIAEVFFFPPALLPSQLEVVSDTNFFNRGGGGNTTPVYRAFLELGDDPSRNMLFNWHSDADTPPGIEFRKQGDAIWQGAGAFVREIPESDERAYVARIPTGDLDPDEVYEIRPIGAVSIWKFRTMPTAMSRPFRFCVVSDWQRNSGVANDPGSMFNVLNGRVAADNPDFIVLAGDYANDDGARSAGLTATWNAFIDAWSTRFVRSDGTMVPIVAIAGNHEAGAPGTGTPGGSWWGNMPYGYMDRIFSTFYRHGSDQVGGQGYGYVTIGTELLLIGLETNHATPIVGDQSDWLEGLLDAIGTEYRHIVVIGHVDGINYRTDLTNSEVSKGVRNVILPILQGRPNLKFFLHGHTHALSVTKKGLWSNSGGDGVAWVANANGIRCLGGGGWDSPATTDYNVWDVTATGGSDPIFSHVLATSGVRNVAPISPVTGTGTDPATRHYWRVDLTTTEIEAKAINLNGGTYVTVTETL